jgi:hypothetical protein
MKKTTLGALTLTLAIADLAAVRLYAGQPEAAVFAPLFLAALATAAAAFAAFAPRGRGDDR